MNCIKEIKVSVLLAVRNGQEFIASSIRSVLSQDFKDFELLISDDNSIDKTIDVIKEFQDERIQLHQQKKSLGQFGNFNFLLSKAEGEIVHFWSHDDIMYPNCLSTIVNFHFENSNLGMSYCSGNYIDKSGLVTREWKFDGTPRLLNKNLYSKYSLTYGCLAGSISQVSLNRKNIGNNYYFIESYLLAGDFELWTRIAEKFTIGFISKKLTSIRNHSSQVSNNASSNYASVVEGIPITNRLMKYVNVDLREKPKIKREVILIHYFQRVMVLFVRKEFKLFISGIKLLSREDNIFLLFLTWIRFRLRTKDQFLKHRRKITSILFD
ncbi:glycosyltransferase [Pedobacter sp. Leaf194]|uniref:glycosyltransferase n=1 Tax=Pedobacter sp. Leaf194 TaxID=1736297 RepID=UPI00070265CA|nr:glycosyltransferase [Pedobacter sp. Leaf194]KQS36137.1 hypothetical protein ASG14_11940 [Pedobacter sp. Leaf194]